MQYLPSLTGRHAATVFGFGLEEQHWYHSSAWDKIWADGKWPLIATEMHLYPVLVRDIYAVVDDPGQTVTLALLTGDKTGKIRAHREELLSSLNPHRFNEKREVVFHDSSSILNVVAHPLPKYFALTVRRSPYAELPLQLPTIGR